MNPITMKTANRDFIEDKYNLEKMNRRASDLKIDGGIGSDLHPVMEENDEDKVEPGVGSGGEIETIDQIIERTDRNLLPSGMIVGEGAEKQHVVIESETLVNNRDRKQDEGNEETILIEREYSHQIHDNDEVSFRETKPPGASGNYGRQPSIEGPIEVKHKVKVKRMSLAKRRSIGDEEVHIENHMSKHFKMLNLKRNLYGYNHSYLSK